MNPQWPYSHFPVPPPNVRVPYQSQVLQQNSWRPVIAKPLSGCSLNSDDLHKPPSEGSSVPNQESVFTSVNSNIPFSVPPPNLVSTKVPPPPTFNSKYLSHNDMSSTLPGDLSSPFHPAIPPPLVDKPSLSLSPKLPTHLPSQPAPLPSTSQSLLENEVHSPKSLATSFLSNKLPVSNDSSSELSLGKESVKVSEKNESSVITSSTNESKCSKMNKSLNPQIHPSIPQLSEQNIPVSCPIVASNELSSNSIKEPISDLSNQYSAVQSTSKNLESFNSSPVRYDQPLQTVLPSCKQSAYPFIKSTSSEDAKSTLVNTSTSQDGKSALVNNSSEGGKQTCSAVAFSQSARTGAQKSTASEINKSFIDSGSVKNTVSTASSFSMQDSKKLQHPMPAAVQASLPCPQVPQQVAVPPPLSVQSSHSSFMLAAPVPSVPVAPHFHLGAAPDLSKGNLLVPTAYNAPLPPVGIHPSYIRFPVPGSVLQTGTPYPSYTSQASPNNYQRMPDSWNKDQNSLPSSSMERIKKYCENDYSSSKDGVEEYSYSDQRYHSLSIEREHFVSNRGRGSVSKEKNQSTSHLRQKNDSSSERHGNNSSTKFHSVSKDSGHSSSKESRQHSSSEESTHHSSSKESRNYSSSKESRNYSSSKESRHYSSSKDYRSSHSREIIPNSCSRESRHRSPTRKSRHRSPTRKSRHCSSARDSKYLSPTREFRHHSVAHEGRHPSPIKDRKNHSSAHSRKYSPTYDKNHCSYDYKHHSSSCNQKSHSSSHDDRHKSAHDHKHDLSSINHRHHSQSEDYKYHSSTKKCFPSPKDNSLFYKDSEDHPLSKQRDHHSPSVEIRKHSSPKQSVSLPVEDKDNNSSINEPKVDSLVKEDITTSKCHELNDLNKNNGENKQNNQDNNNESKNCSSGKGESKSQSKKESYNKNLSDRSFEKKSVDSFQKGKRHHMHSAKSPYKRERSSSISEKSPKKRKDDPTDSFVSSNRRSSKKLDNRFERETSSMYRNRSSERSHRRDSPRNRRESFRDKEQHSRNDKKMVRYRRRRSSTPKDLPCLSLKDYKYVCSNLAEDYYCLKEETSLEVTAKDALKKLHEKFRFELVERAERIRASKPKYEPPKRKTKLRKPKPPKTCSNSDSSSSEEKSSSEEEDTAMEELERKKKHPYRLHLELWFNDPKEMNDGPLCRCSAKARRAGIRHGIYVGEEHLPLCEPLSNNKNRLYHYRITMTPHTNFLTKNPTTICHDGHEYRFEGFSMFSHSPLPQLPNCKVIRFNYEYTILYKEEDFPQNFTIEGLELFNNYLLNEILELVDLNWRAYTDSEGCPRFHFMPRFSRELKDGGKELLSHCYVLEYLLKANQILVDDKKLPEILKLDNHKWQDLADEVKGMIVTCPGMKPSSIRVDQLDREQCETDKHEFPVIVHFGVRPPQLSYAGNPYYQKAWRDYVKYRHLLANKPKVKYADRHKLMQKETRLQEMRMENDLKRDVTVVISSKNFYKTGIMSDVVQHAMLLPVLVCHLRFHDSLTHLENKIGYKFQDRYLLQLALTHPSYRENFGTNPDHARNSLTNCGLRQPQYGDRRIHYMNTRKRGINTLINIMSRFGSRKETLSRINHNERLEFLGDAVVEFLSSIHLFYMFPDLEEGGLATYRAAIVQNQHLAVLSKKLELDRFMLYAHGSDLCHDLELRHAMANCFEALMGALFLDNGIEIADKVFSKTLFTEQELLEVWKNFPPHPLQEQEPNGDRKWIDSVPLLQNLHKFEEAIGIEFNHIRLLARALTHRSLGYNNLTLGSNQRLEFLGDTVLQLVASEYLYKFFPEHHEGHLSLLRSSLVNNRTQAVVCADLGMVEYAIYPYSKVELKPKDKADLLEAFLGALYVDKDLGYCRKFCEVCFFPRLQDFIMNQDWNDPKSKLQQCCLTLRSMDGGEPDIPTYKVIECKGPTNTRVYSVAVYFQGNRLAVGSGHSIQQAEMDAAANALKKSKDLFPQLRHQRRAIERSLKKGPPKKHQDSSKDLS